MAAQEKAYRLRLREVDGEERELGGRRYTLRELQSMVVAVVPDEADDEFAAKLWLQVSKAVGHENVLVLLATSVELGTLEVVDDGELKLYN